MREHWHLSIDQVLLTTAAVLVTIHAVRMLSGRMISAGGPVGTAGQVIAGLVKL